MNERMRSERQKGELDRMINEKSKKAGFVSLVLIW